LTRPLLSRICISLSGSASKGNRFLPTEMVPPAKSTTTLSPV